MSGPDLLLNLVLLFSRFREHEISMMADIEAMFLQVKVPPDDYKNLSFLWRKTFNIVVEVYGYTRHRFGAKISPLCANHALQQTGIYKKILYPLASRAIQQNFYMDDFAKSVATEDEEIELYQQLKPSLQNGEFNLIKWLSNNTSVMESLDDADKTEKIHFFGGTKSIIFSGPSVEYGE